MGSVDSEEGSERQSSERCYGSYSLSADVSESESCSSATSFSCRRFAGGAPSSSITSTSRGNASETHFQLSTADFTGKSVTLDWENARLEKDVASLTEMELMKERFAKLLLGEDMSGGGKGVCTALAISNAITNLSASVFGEIWRLEPLGQGKKCMWKREMEWLLCVSDSIVELVPTVQEFPGGGTYEVMKSRPRSDLNVSLPALRKLDAMLISKLESFRETEFWYVERGIIVDDYVPGLSSGRMSVRQEEKWWLPCPKVPSGGMSDVARKMLQECRDCTNQILKAAMAINSSVLSEMEIPGAYVDSLPKNGKECLGETLYRVVTGERFCPEEVLERLDLSTEHLTLDMANKVEAALNVWKMKGWKKQGKGKKNGLAQRAEALLRALRVRCPGLAQTALEMNKIQYNKDVGQAILESYSRVMESLAFNIMARIDDVLYVEEATRKCTDALTVSWFRKGALPIQKRLSPSPFSLHHTPFTSPFATPSTPVAASPPRPPPNASFLLPSPIFPHLSS